MQESANAMAISMAVIFAVIILMSLLMKPEVRPIQELEELQANRAAGIATKAPPTIANFTPWRPGTLPDDGSGGPQVGDSKSTKPDYEPSHRGEQFLTTLWPDHLPKFRPDTKAAPARQMDDPVIVALMIIAFVIIAIMILSCIIYCYRRQKGLHGVGGKQRGYLRKPIGPINGYARHKTGRPNHISKDVVSSPIPSVASYQQTIYNNIPNSSPSEFPTGSVAASVDRQRAAANVHRVHSRVPLIKGEKIATQMSIGISDGSISSASTLSISDSMRMITPASLLPTRTRPAIFKECEPARKVAALAPSHLHQTPCVKIPNTIAEENCESSQICYSHDFVVISPSHDNSKIEAAPIAASEASLSDITGTERIFVEQNGQFNV